MSVPLQFDAHGAVVSSGRVSIDGEDRGGSLLSITFVSRDCHVQSLVRADPPYLDRSQPRVILPSLSREFLFRALVSDLTFAMEFSGTYCGEVTLVTHLETYYPSQSISRYTASAYYDIDRGLRLECAGALAPPLHILDEFHRDHPAPFQWPTTFAVRGQVPWDGLPFLFGDAYYFARLLARLRRRQAEPAQQT